MFIRTKKNKFLVKTLYGLLFILPKDPKSILYDSIYKRIKHIEVLSLIEHNTKKEENIK